MAGPQRETFAQQEAARNMPQWSKRQEPPPGQGGRGGRGGGGRGRGGDRGGGGGRGRGRGGGKYGHLGVNFFVFLD